MCNQCDVITPLSSLDSAGHVLNEGDSVKIIHIPDWVYGGLGQESADVIKGCAGEIMTIEEIDEHGYVWVKKIVEDAKGSMRPHSFSNDPQHFLKVFG